MIATPRFVFLHLHKSGGTFVNECLLRYVSGARQLGYHLPYAALPPGLSHLPVLGLVRNPWSYYVSWYAFQASRPQPNPLFRVLSDGGRLDFAGTIRNLLSLGHDDRLLDAVIGALPATYTNRGLNLPGPALAPIRGSGLGFYAYLYQYIFGGAERLQVGCMETLRTDLARLLESIGEPVGPELRRHLLTAAPRNVSPHGAYPEYYDTALRELVKARDASVIERYGYCFSG